MITTILVYIFLISIIKQNGIIWIETNGTLPTFSFFNLLFFDNSLYLSEVEKERIVNHELAHIRQRHEFKYRRNKTGPCQI